MADGEVTVKLDPETKQRLEAMADAAGQSVGDYVRDLIAQSLNEENWSEDLAALEEYDRTGMSYSVEESMAVFDAAMKAHLE